MGASAGASAGAYASASASADVDVEVDVDASAGASASASALCARPSQDLVIPADHAETIGLVADILHLSPSDVTDLSIPEQRALVVAVLTTRTLSVFNGMGISSEQQITPTGRASQRFTTLLTIADRELERKEAFKAK